jgi:hypothetical protein
MKDEVDIIDSSKKMLTNAEIIHGDFFLPSLASDCVFREVQWLNLTHV